MRSFGHARACSGMMLISLDFIMLILFLKVVIIAFLQMMWYVMIRFARRNERESS